MTETILIADDSVSIREAAQAALAPRGARIEMATDGREALTRLRDAAPDLVIADVHMPGLDGYALCREAKTERAATRVLLVVGTFEPFDTAGAAAARADGVLRKPFLAEDLLRKVEELLGRPAAGAAPATVAAPPVEEPAPRAVAAAAETEAAPAARTRLSDDDVERIARRVLEIGGEAVLERVARELLGEAAAERVRRSGGFPGAAERE